MRDPARRPGRRSRNVPPRSDRRRPFDARAVPRRPGRGRHVRPGRRRAGGRGQAVPLDVVRLPPAPGPRLQPDGRLLRTRRASTRPSPTWPTRCWAPACDRPPTPSSRTAGTTPSALLGAGGRPEAAVVHDPLRPRRRRTRTGSPGSSTGSSTGSPDHRTLDRLGPDRLERIRTAASPGQPATSALPPAPSLP